MATNGNTTNGTHARLPPAIEHLTTILSPAEIITPSFPEYPAESTPWAAQKDLHPTLVVRPYTVESLSRVLKYLAGTSLDFAVRSQGYGSASAKDVLVSLTAFNEFKWDKENEVVYLGAGCRWSEYYEQMAEVAPEYSVVACRTPCIGVGGSVLCGGFSWMGAEFGCSSDPQNMLDAQVVTLDGRVMWASEEPDLLWALRGAGSSFAVVTTFKFRAHRYTQKILAGAILLPKSSVQEVAKGIVQVDARPNDPKVGFFIYVMPKHLLHNIGADQDMLVVHGFDAHGEDHGRGEDGFAWALRIPGAIDTMTVQDMKGVAGLQAHIEGAKGKTISYWSPFILPTPITVDLVLRAFAWFDKVTSSPGTVSRNAYLLFEMRSMSTNHIEIGDTAWPRPQGNRNILLLGTGCDTGAPVEEAELAKQLVLEGPAFVLQTNAADIDFVPNTIEDFHSPKQIFGVHYSKLQELKKRFDPKSRLKGAVHQ